MKNTLATILFFVTHPAWASPAEDAFKAGQFAQSASAARAECTDQIEMMKRIRVTADALAAIKTHAADACALAARATLTIAAYQTNDRAKAEALIDQALGDAAMALAQHTDHVEGTLQTAVALGYRAKLRQSPGIAKDAKKYMDRALQLAPGNGFAAIALAGWNGESVADIGSFLAGTVLGAKKDVAIKYYEQALKLDAASPSFPVFYAFNLYRLDDSKYAAKVTQLLSTAITLKPRDGFEVLNIAHARDVLTALKSGDRARAKALIKQYQPFGVLLKK